MNTNTNYIDSIINEAALDPRVDSGIVDLNNPIHVRVVAETMYDYCKDETLVNEFVKKFVEEGKYPDRQAYNKEGWLVTFPSKQYRDAAIKKGTHSIADPTHGKGGMNLYYKKKGKQQRQTQQDTTVTNEPAQPATANPASPQPDSANPPANNPSSAPDDETAGMTPEEAAEFNKAIGAAPEDSDAPQKEPAPSNSDSTLPPAGGEEKPTAPAAPAAPEKPAAPAAPPPPSHAELSKKFASSKGWSPTPYGDWRDAQGGVAAVESQLSHEVVPVKAVDRDELKIYVEKQSA